MNDLFPSWTCGKALLGYHVMYPAPGILETVHREWDWFWLDAQHGQLDDRTTLECVRTARGLGVPAVIRVQGHGAEAIGRAVDTGAAGIMVPMVESAEDARRIIQAACFPPLGKRSFGGRRPIDLYGRLDVVTSQRAPRIILQIETPSGVDQADPIAGVEGVDALFYGADDMRSSMGLSMDTPSDHPDLARGLEATVRAARSHHRLAGAVASSSEDFERILSAGVRLVAVCGDARSVRAVSAATSADFRAVLARFNGKRQEPGDIRKPTGTPT